MSFGFYKDFKIYFYDQKSRIQKGNSVIDIWVEHWEAQKKTLRVSQTKLRAQWQLNWLWSMSRGLLSGEDSGW